MHLSAYWESTAERLKAAAVLPLDFLTCWSMLLVHGLLSAPEAQLASGVACFKCRAGLDISVPVGQRPEARHLGQTWSGLQAL